MGPVFLCQQFVSSSMEDEWPTVSPASTSSTGLSLSNYLSSSSVLPSLYVCAILSAHMLSLCMHLVILTSFYPGPSSPLLTWMI